MLQNEIKDLNLKSALCVFKLFTMSEGPNIMTSTQKGDEEVLKFVVCLRFYCF